MKSKVFYMKAERLNAGDTIVDLDGREWPITKTKPIGRESVKVEYINGEWEFYDKREDVKVKRD